MDLGRDRQCLYEGGFTSYVRVMKVVFRYDDFSAAPWIPLEIDRAVFSVFLECRSPLLLGVTPQMSAAPRDSTNKLFYSIEDDACRRGLLQEASAAGWQVALHGYNHQCPAAADGTEFRTLSFEAQTSKIAAGLEIMCKVWRNSPIDIFIPPWNSFDRVTIKTLGEFRMQTLCGGDELFMSRNSSLTFVPSLFSLVDLTRFTDALSLSDVSRLLGSASMVVTLHHYDFWDRSRPGYVGLEQLRKTLRYFQEAGVNIGLVTPDDSPLPLLQQIILSEKILAKRRRTWRQRHTADSARAKNLKLTDAYYTIRWVFRAVCAQLRWRRDVAIQSIKRNEIFSDR
jgi:hypothetical protein